MNICTKILIVFNITLNGICMEPIKEKDSSIGLVTDEYGDAIYGSSIEYSKELYLGRVSYNAKIKLLDINVKKNTKGIPIIKIKIITNPGRKSNVGKIGWVSLRSTNFSDFYDPKTNKIIEHN